MQGPGEGRAQETKMASRLLFADIVDSSLQLRSGPLSRGHGRAFQGLGRGSKPVTTGARPHLSQGFLMPCLVFLPQYTRVF